MSLPKNLEKEIEDTEVQLSKLQIEIGQLNREYNELFETLEITPEQLSDHIENPENFSSEEWAEIQEEKKKIDQKLVLDVSNIPNPLKTRKTLSEQSLIQQHWIFVR